MLRLGLVVEGHGEVEAAPILLRRIVGELAPEVYLELPPPHRVSRGKLVKETELKRAVELMARKTSPDGAVLILLDADGDNPAELGPRLLRWASEQRSDRSLAVVVAKEEYEAWFLAAARSLAGLRGLPAEFGPFIAPEDLRSPKSRLGRAMPSGYSETLDQPAFTASFDLYEARACCSFDKLCRDVARLVHSHPRAGQGVS